MTAAVRLFTIWFAALFSFIVAAAPATTQPKPAIRSTPATHPIILPAVEIRKIDGTSVKATLRGLRDGKLVLDATDGKGIAPESLLPLEDVIELVSSAASSKEATANAAARKLTGTVIGTEGSFQDKGNTRDKVFDGKFETFFDAPQEHADDAWVGLDLGSPKRITQIKFAPRSGQYTGSGKTYASRMISGKFQGSSAADFSTGVVDFLTITAAPPANRLTVQDVATPAAFRYVRYLSPETGHGNLAEMEVWGRDVVAEGALPPGQGTRCEVVLAAGDHFHAVLGGWDEKQVSVSAAIAAGGKLGLAVNQLRELWLGTPEQIAKAKALKLDPGPEDAAFVVKDGDVVSVRGIALGVEGESLRFKFNDQERKIGLAKLVGVVLGGQEAKRDDSFRQAVQLSGGDVVSGTWNTFDKNTIGLETSWGGKLQIPFASVTKVNAINGRLVYVSDLKPSRIEQVPYFDRLMPWRADHSLTGGVLKLSDGEYPKGLAVHSRCVLEYEIGGKYETFAAKIGFQQPEGRLGRAVVRVLGDGQTLYEDLDARGDAAKPAEVSVKVTGVQRLALEVDFGKDEDTGDRVVWANARLLRAAAR